MDSEENPYKAFLEFQQNFSYILGHLACPTGLSPGLALARPSPLLIRKVFRACTRTRAPDSLYS